MHTTYEVSTKAALYSPDHQLVLVIKISENSYGLPGGHVEKDEEPDHSIARELYEELGIQDLLLDKKDFFRHGGGKIILAYTGTFDYHVPLASTQENSEGEPLWISLEQFSALNIDSGYKIFVLENWPA